mmetsp:Transcript_28968/g.40770  ORF Transcript_28968/g.40770 Transcript_28968/m.40770 type:complete len:293 (-) Transcript_28968:59-937(-)
MSAQVEVLKDDKPKRKRRGTFNQLEEKYQILPEHSPDHMFEDELIAISEFRKKIPECKELSDKALVTFLCARRHKMDEVEELLQKYFSKKKELGLDSNPTTADDAWKVFKTGHSMRFKNCIDKHDRLVIYTKIALDDPSATTVEDKLRALFWGVEQIIHVEPLKYIRNGMICIVDLSGFGFKNLDMKHGKEVNEALTGVLPRRVRKIYVYGGGLLVKMAMSAAKMVLSKKLMKRVETIDEAGMKDLIPSEWLLEEYGGNLKLTLADYQQQLFESQKLMDDNVKQHLEKQNSL